MDKAYIDTARLLLGFRNDSGTIPERFRYDYTTIPLRFRDPFCVKSARNLHEIFTLDGVQPE